MKRLLLALLLFIPAQAKPGADELCRQAEAHLRGHEIKAGTDKYFQAIRLDRKCAKAWAGLGAVYYEASQSREAGNPAGLIAGAFEFLDHAIELNPKDDKSYFYRGDLYTNKKQYAKALKDLNRSIAINPNSLAYMPRALCYSALKQDDKAVDDYSRVYKITRNPMALYSRGNCYQRLGQPEKALTDYQQVVADSDDPQVVSWAKKELTKMRRQFGELSVPKSTSEQALELFDKGRELKNSGHAKESLKVFDQALALDPKFAKAAIMKGDAYFMLNDLDHAIQYYKKGLLLDPSDKQGHRFLGDVLERKYIQTNNRKVLEEAIQHYRTALRLDPSYGSPATASRTPRPASKPFPSRWRTCKRSRRSSSSPEKFTDPATGGAALESRSVRKPPTDPRLHTAPASGESEEPCHCRRRAFHPCGDCPPSRLRRSS